MTSHRMPQMLRRFALLLALAGCRLTSGPTSALSLVVTPAQGSVRAGQNLQVEVLVTNIGEIAVSLYGPVCDYPFEARAPGGGVVPPPSAQICAAILRGPTTLGPGETHRFPSVWLTRGPQNGTALAAGVYELRPTNFTVRGARMELRSTSVTVTN